MFVVIALKRPHWAFISSQPSKDRFTMKPDDAILLTSVLAKAIELSFTMAFVTFLGQVISRRALLAQSSGVSISDLSMWRWVVQPGTLITHWETAKFSGTSVLGVLSLLSAISATLYTSAAAALIQPTLSLGQIEFRTLQGECRTGFANATYLKNTCSTPIRTDREYGGSTCRQIYHAKRSYSNYQSFISAWANIGKNMNPTSVQKERLTGSAMLYDNVTVIPQWIDDINTTKVSQHFRRAINNVTLAMPHAGIYKAAHDPYNNITHPNSLNLNLEGVYSLRSALPSLAVNVLCANADRDELEPIVYQSWNPDAEINTDTWAQARLMKHATTVNVTNFDSLFGWTKKDKKGMTDYPPVFSRLPDAFNTILNHSSYLWARKEIYVLGQGGKDDASDYTGEFFLCKMRAILTDQCITRFNTTLDSSGSLEALCNNPKDSLALKGSNQTRTGDFSVSDWQNIAFDWANSVSLGTGIINGKSSNARLLSQLILQKNKDGNYELNPGLPSTAEALAVMAGHTVLDGTIDACFSAGRNPTKAMLEEPEDQDFDALIQIYRYISAGGKTPASTAWNAVLIVLFLINVIVLEYFLIRHKHVTDFSKPQNLLTLALNSPPSKEIAGSCGCGPEGQQYGVKWRINVVKDHLYLAPAGKSTNEASCIKEHRDSPTSAINKINDLLSSITRGLRNRHPYMRSASTEMDYELGDRSLTEAQSA